MTKSTRLWAWEIADQVQRFVKDIDGKQFVDAADYDKLAARLAEAEKTLRFATKQLDMHDCQKGSSYFDGENRVVTDCPSCDEVKRARDYFEKHKAVQSRE